MNPKVVACPACGKPMRVRSGARGEFYGCSGYPACRKTLPVEGGATAPPKPGIEPIRILSGSPEQETIWEAIAKGSTHVVVEACAGSGKTFTMIQVCLRNRMKAITFVAFNKHIAAEAGGKLQASGCTNVNCRTYHSLGFSMIRSMYPGVQVNEDKIEAILNTAERPTSPLTGLPISDNDWGYCGSFVRKFVNYCRTYMLKGTERERILELADHFGVEVNNPDGSLQPMVEVALTLVPWVLLQCKKLANVMIDYNDMIWLPTVLDLPAPKTDLLICDEFQDTDPAQQELVFRAMGDGRLIVVGDRNQAIYGFRGADIDAIPNLIVALEKTERGVQVFPLTVTRRCPVSHVILAAAIVPQIRPMEGAKEGTITTMSPSLAVREMQPNDMVLCRCNAPLVHTAYDLIRRGVRPIIRGRDIGKGLIDLIEKLQKRVVRTTHAGFDENAYGGGSDLAQFEIALNQYFDTESLRLSKLGRKGENRLAALQDKRDCLREMCNNVKSISELKATVETLFADFDAEGIPRNAVVLSTVHRGKGLEAERVFILSPELLPHPMAKAEWERKQERNLAYVAATRSTDTLVFCGPVPMIYET